MLYRTDVFSKLIAATWDAQIEASGIAKKAIEVLDPDRVAGGRGRRALGKEAIAAGVAGQLLIAEQSVSGDLAGDVRVAVGAGRDACGPIVARAARLADPRIAGR